MLCRIIGRIVGTVGNKADPRLKDYYAKPYHQSMGLNAFEDTHESPNLRFMAFRLGCRAGQSIGRRSGKTGAHNGWGRLGTFIALMAGAVAPGGLIEKGNGLRCR